MPNRLTRSARLRKYESVYNSYLKKIKNRENSNTVRRKSPEKNKPKSAPQKSVVKEKKSHKKNLTSYQKYVKKESKKKKYKNLPPRERLVHIAKSWKQKNRSGNFTPP